MIMASALPEAVVKRSHESVHQKRELVYGRREQRLFLWGEKRIRKLLLCLSDSEENQERQPDIIVTLLSHYFTYFDCCEAFKVEASHPLKAISILIERSSFSPVDRSLH